MTDREHTTGEPDVPRPADEHSSVAGASTGPAGVYERPEGRSGLVTGIIALLVLALLVFLLIQFVF